MRPHAVYRLLGLLVLLAVGCRLPKPYFAERLHFDRLSPWAGAEEVGPSTGKPVARGHSKPNPIRRVSTTGRLEYAETLAPPVAVLDWDPGVSSRWEILYGTNRTPTSASELSLVRYGNTVAATPQYGVCTVRLPHRARGQDLAPAPAPPPEPTSPLPRGLFVSAPRPKTDRHDRDTQLRGQLETVQALPAGHFAEELRDMTARSVQKDVLVFVHGFNVSYDEAVLRATQVAADLPFNGAIVVYSWPSQGGVDSYERDGEVVLESELPFTEFLTTVANSVPADARINLVVHSMGNRLVQRSLWRLPDEFTSPPRFDEIVFCAPDVGIEEFRRNVRQAKKVAHRVTLYQCCNDAALIASMFRNKEERAGSPNAPVLIEGMDTIETAPVDSSLLGHSYYGSNTSVLRDLFAIVKEHTPVDERPWLKSYPIPFQKSPFWIFGSFPEELDWEWTVESEGNAVLSEQGHSFR